ncbi:MULTISPECIES: response regulator [Sciscionella]|uniref:response regulator n=1 Tax=Sciscionella TaxID=596495 RepID=UPI000377AC74|nr:MULTISPECIES: response regulator transcription factor [Sciscionella]
MNRLAPEAAAAEHGGQGAQLRRAVLVDDHQLVLDGLARLANRFGIKVVAAFLDPAEAIRFLTSRTIDLLVVDLRLGSLSGVDLVRSARLLSPGVHIAMLTSYDDPTSAASALDAGARSFLLKSTPSEELGKQLRAAADGQSVIDVTAVPEDLSEAEISLTPNERAVLELVAEGLTNREIGERIHLSRYTVKDHLTRVMRKLGTGTRTKTVTRAVQYGLLEEMAVI